MGGSARRSFFPAGKAPAGVERLQGAICSADRRDGPPWADPVRANGAGSGLWPLFKSAQSAEVPAHGAGTGGATFVRPKVAKSHRGNTPQNIPFCGGPKDLTPSVAPHRGIPAGCAALAALACPGPSTASLWGDGPCAVPPPAEEAAPPSFGRGTGGGESRRRIELGERPSRTALPKPRGSFETMDAASPAPPGSVPKVES